MAEQELIEYIKKARAGGMSDEQIRGALREASWDDAAVEATLMQPKIESVWLVVEKWAFIGIVGVLTIGLSWFFLHDMAGYRT